MNLSKSDQLLVRACLADPTESVNLFKEWETRIIWDKLDFGSRRLLPLLYQKIVDTGIRSLTLTRLERVFYQSLLRGLIQESAAMQPLLRFKSEGIQVIVLKGFALRQQIYEIGNATRPINDLDLLILKTDFELVHDLLRSTHLTPEFIVNRNYNLSYRKEALFKGPKIDFDIHWRILELASGPNFDEMLWNETEPISVRGDTFTALNHEASLFHSIAHSVSWNSVKNLTWIIDSIKLIESEKVNWDKFAQLCRLSGWQRPVLNRLAFLELFTSFKIPQMKAPASLFALGSLETNLMIRHLSTPSRFLRRVQRFLYAESLHSANTEYLSSFRAWTLLQIKTLLLLFVSVARNLMGKSS